MASITPLGLIAGLAVGMLVSFLWFLIWRVGYTRAVRLDAVQRSQAVTAGKVFEQLIPYLPGFAFNPKDARFLGSPVDFVVFDGLSDGAVRRVVFLEVKTGGAELSRRERQVRDAVEAQQVVWAEIRAGA
jgi:predicted Holliday junction resolvase-like endonuclease